MTVMNTGGGGGGSAAGALYDVIELILDRGLVIDVFVRVSLVGIEVLTIDARVVVSSIDTYLRFARECGRLDLTGGRQPMGLPDLVGQITEGAAEHKVKGALEGAGHAIVESITDLVTPDKRSN